MREIKEKDLKQEVKFFNNKAVIIKYTGLVNSLIHIKKLSIHFNYRTGLLYMKDLITKSKFKVNIAPAYNMEVKEDKTQLLIQLDNDIDINIKIKK